jgi:hypothetical protein
MVVPPGKGYAPENKLLIVMARLLKLQAGVGSTMPGQVSFKTLHLQVPNLF